MLAFALTIAIFAFWSVVGFSLVSALNSRKNLLRNALLSPVVGAAATVLVVLWANVAGAPLKRVSLAITVVLFAGAILWLARSWPILPIRRLVPFLVVLLVAALLTGYPLLRFGFDWVSYGNEDMANYTLGATYFSNYAFFPVPPAERIVGDRDASAFLWFYLVNRAERPGVQLTNGWIASSTFLSSHQTYMPLILALHLVLISTTGALLLQCRKYRLIALLACIWLASSSLNTLGTLYQLIAQVFGLALLAGACVMVCAGFAHVSRRLAIGRIALSAILCAALLVVYPEILPFFAVTAFLYHFMLLVRKQESLLSVLRFTAYVALGAVLMVNVVAIGVVADVAHRLTYSLHSAPAASVLFPYYLLPSGLAHLWGFHPIGKELSGPFLSLGIGMGAILLLGTCVGAAWHAWRGQVVAIMCLAMVVIGLRAFAVRTDFVLYKLAMYVQPFLLGTAVLSWFEVIAWGQRAWGSARLRQIVLFGPLAVLIGAGLTAQAYYTERSLGGVGGGFVEVPGASSTHLVSQLIAMSHKSRPPAIISDTNNIVLAKIQGNYMMPTPTFFTASDFMHNFLESFTESTLRASPWGKFLNWIMPGFSDRVKYIQIERDKRFRHVQFDSHGALPSPDAFDVRVDTYDSELEHATLVQSVGQGIMNRRSSPPSQGSIFRTSNLAQASNQLFYIESEFGMPYTDVENRFKGRVSMFQAERDYFYPQSTMVSMGKDTLLRVVNPSRKFRLALEYTASLNSDHENRIPAISVVGTERRFLAIEGRGSTRLFSPVIQPQEVGGGSYFLLDMGTPGFRFASQRTGLMALYGTDTSLDARVITGFGRDVSVLSEEEYEDLAAPDHVGSFPADLMNRGLEYSGVYEDGWVAESSYLMLGQRKERSPLLVRVMVPVIEGKPASSQLVVLMDGAEVARRSLLPGNSQFTIPGPGVGRHRVELVFDKAAALPAPDSRPASALIGFVGFLGDRAKAPNEAATDAPDHVGDFPADLKNLDLEYGGIYEDGWVAESSYMVLGQQEERWPLLVRVMVPLFNGKPASSQLVLLMDGSEVARRSLEPGNSEFTIPDASVGRHRIELVFDRATALPTPDPGSVSAMIRFLEPVFGRIGTPPTPDSRPVSAMIRFVGFLGHRTKAPKAAAAPGTRSGTP